jgi:predicted ester cyclase
MILKLLKVKTGIMELGNDVLFKLMELYIFKTDEICREWTHLRRTKLQDQLVVDKFWANC